MPPRKTTETGEKASPKTNTATKVSSRKPVTSARTKAKSQAEKNAENIAKNAHEIEHNTKMIHLLYGAIIVLLMIIAGLAFYIGQMLGSNGNVANQVANNQNPEVNIRVIDDARCLDCQTDAILSQLRSLPFLSNAEYTIEDFSDPGVSEYMNENGITALPAIVFDTNALFDGGQITPFLSSLPNGEYSLSIGADFDPFAKRSANGYLVMQENILNEATNIGYKKGNSESAILWLEFSDLDCPACRALYTQNTDDVLFESFGDSLSKAIVHFPLDSIHPNARAKAEHIECAGELGGNELFYSLIDENFDGNIGTDDIVRIAVEAGVNENDMNTCIQEDRYANKVQAHMDFGSENFGVNSTPTNIVINTETGEYQEIRGAAGVESFQTVIESMLQ